MAWLDEVIDGNFGRRVKDMLDERALAGLADSEATDKIRREHGDRPGPPAPALVREVVLHGGPTRGRRADHEPRAWPFEITRVPAAVRAHAEIDLRPEHLGYQRVTFDKATSSPALDAKLRRGVGGGRSDLTGHAAADRGREQGHGRPRCDCAAGGGAGRRVRPVTDPRLLANLDYTIVWTTPSPTGAKLTTRVRQVFV